MTSAFKSVFDKRALSIQNAALTRDTGLRLNFSSGQLNFLAGNLGNFSNITIDVGGHKKTVALNTRLSAAEAVAAQQVLSGGSQTIEIGARGTAIGGSLSLTNGLLGSVNGTNGSSLSTLRISRGVAVVDDVSALNVSGCQSRVALTSVGTTISARSILNSSSAEIGSLSVADLVLTAMSNLKLTFLGQ